MISFLLFAFSSTIAAGPDQARLLLLDASYCKVAVSQKVLTTDPSELAKLDADRAKATADLEQAAPAAINSAAGSPDLENAVKAFYASADSYCKNPSDAGK